MQLSDVNLTDEDILKRVQRCKGFDYFAGELVANAVQAGELDA